jgi:hypothetical protein
MERLNADAGEVRELLMLKHGSGRAEAYSIRIPLKLPDAAPEDPRSCRLWKLHLDCRRLRLKQDLDC